MHRGNDELRQALADGGGRLWGVATINPRYATWERDLGQAINDWGFKAVRLAPQYHDYDLSDGHGQAALAAIDELRVPAVFHERIEDHRQQHAWDRAMPMSFEHVAHTLRKFPNMKVLWLNGMDVTADAVRHAGLEGRILIDINRFDVTLFNRLEQLIEQLTPSAFAFGTHMPMSYVAPALLRMDVLRLSDQDEQRIAWRNATAFLDLDIGADATPDSSAV